MALFSWAAQAAAWERTGSTLQAESCPNGYFDPGETNTVTFTIKNVSGGNLEEVQVELVADGANIGTADNPNIVSGSNVDFVISPKTEKITVNKDATTSVTFTFRTSGTCGRDSAVNPRLLVTWKTAQAETVVFSGDKLAHNGQLGATVQTQYTFNNGSSIAINDLGNSDRPGYATPYPSTVTATGVPNNTTDTTGERIVNVAVTLRNVTHPTQSEVAALLVGPLGQKVVLFRGAGNPIGGFANTTFTISGFSDTPAPINGNINDGGTYGEVDWAPGSNFYGSAPAGPYDSSLDVFKSLPGAGNSRDPNGAWSLYIIDRNNNGGGVAGQIAGGWTLTLTTEKIVCCDGGATAPSITKYADQRPKPSIADITIKEDTIFNSDEGSADLKITPIPFRVTDLETPGDITVSAISADQTKIKNSNIKFATTTVTGPGGVLEANRTMEFKPEPNANGDVNVTLVATDAAGRSSTLTFLLKISSINDVPTFPNPVRNQQVNVGQPTPPLPFTVTDVETPANQLVLTATSLDPGVVPNANIVLTGAGNDWTVTVIPVSTGTARIRINATDANGGVGKMGPSDQDYSFRVDFTAPVGNPTLSPFDNQTFKEDEPKSIGFTVRSGSSTPVDNLLITTSSTNPNLLPVGNIAITGSGTERTMTLTPVLNANSVQVGTAQITVRVNDGGRETQQQFTVNVTAVNDKPTISAIPAQTISEDSETTVIAFKVGDIETFNGNLAVTARSSNPQIVPNTVTAINGKNYGIFLTSGPNPDDRSVKVVPLPNTFGRLTIFIDVTDSQVNGAGPDTTTGSIALEVQPVNDAPSIAQAGPSGNLVNLANNANDAPVVIQIAEDTGVIASDNIQAQTAVLGGISAGVPSPLNEIEQTVTISASVDKPGIISTVYFDPGDDNKVKNPKTQTNLRYKLVPNAYGDVVVTLTLTDNGTGALGGDNLSTTRKFTIQVVPQNDQPTLTATPPTRDLPHGQAIVVPIEVKDTETSPSNMIITATSSDTATVPLVNIIPDPSQGIVAIIPVTPADLGPRDVTITLRARDRGASDDLAAPPTVPIDDPLRGASQTVQFVLKFRNLPINRPPTLSAVNPGSATVQEDGFATAAVTISDPDGNDDVAGARLSASSSNPQLIDGSNVLFGGIGANRSIAFAPKKDANGTATIAIVATDPAGFSSPAQEFKLTVISVEDAPSVVVTESTGDNTPWSGGAIVANEDVAPVKDVKTASGLIEVKVSDPETSADNLIVTAKSSNQNLVPDANIVVSSTGGTRTLTISPVANRSGDATITVRAQDSAGSKVNGDYPLDTFIVRINPVNDEPTLNNPVASGTLTVGKNAPLQTVSLTGITAGPEEGGQTANPAQPAQVLTLRAVAINKGSNRDDHRNDFIQPISGTDVIEAVFSGNSQSTITASTEPITGLVRFQPKPNVFGTSTIIVTLTDNGGTDRNGDNTKEIQFDVVITDANTAPTISIPSNFQDVQVLPNTSSPVIPISVSDAVNETPANQLKLSFSSSNPSVVANDPSSFQETGTGQSRGVIIKPLANAFGTANITITVTDTGRPADGTQVLSASQTIKLTVSAGQNPVVSQIPDTSTRVNTDTDVIQFTVNDAQTPAGNLIVTATSDNQSVVPNFNIQLGGSGSSRALIIRPAQDRSGIANITVTAKDADNNTGSSTFKLTVLGQPPTISAITDRLNMAPGSSTGTIPFTVTDAETFPGFLNVTPTSSNPNLVPTGNIFLGGSGSNRTVNVTLVAGQTGTSLITLTVTDGEGQSAQSKFNVSTQSSTVDEAPTIQPISNQSIVLGGTFPIIPVTVSDKETPAADLRVTATSSNTQLIPPTGIFLGGSGNTRSLLLSPAQGQTGTSTILVTVTDNAGKTASTSFTATVSTTTPSRAANDFNGDGTQDIVLQDGGGFVAAWFMSGDALLSSSFFTPNNVGDAGWKTVGTGDFDADGKTDLLFQHTDGSLAVWRLNGTTLTTSSFLNPANSGGPAWKAVATADFNKDGKVDVLFHNTDGSLALWYMDGLNLASVAPLKPGNSGKGWNVVGTGDINVDSNMDIVFQHDDGTLAVWYLVGGNNLLLPGLLSPQHPGDANWRAVGTIDLNGDTKTDLLLQNRADNNIAVWYMNKEKLILGKLLTPSNPGGTWRVVAP